jgi:hypothetical protein
MRDLQTKLLKVSLESREGKRFIFEDVDKYLGEWMNEWVDQKMANGNISMDPFSLYFFQALV